MWSEDLKRSHFWIGRGILCVAIFAFISGWVVESAKAFGEDIKRAALIKRDSLSSLRVVTQSAFKRGEEIHYRMHYGWMEAGEVVVALTNEQTFINGRKIYHSVSTGRTKGMVDFFYKVEDRYESYFDAEALAPWAFIRRVNEGGYIINQNYIFNLYANKVDAGNHNEFSIPDYCQDMVSAFYYARSINYDNAQANQVFTIVGFVDKEVFPIKIRFIGREVINSDLGKIRCLKFRPILQKGRIFKKEEDLNVWVSDDNNHIPVLAQAEMLVGSVKMELSACSGLANPLGVITSKN